MFRVHEQRVHLRLMITQTFPQFIQPPWELLCTNKISYYELDFEDIQKRIWYVDRFGASVANEKDIPRVYQMAKRLFDDIVNDYPLFYL